MCNIYTGEIAAANVNVQSALRIGEEMMTKFESSLLEVITVGKINEKSAKYDHVKFDIDTILTRVLYLPNQNVKLKRKF